MSSQFSWPAAIMSMRASVAVQDMRGITVVAQAGGNRLHRAETV